MRRGLFLFTIFASGIGAYGIRLLEPIRFLPELEAQRYWPMDLWVPEFTVFTTLYHNPLFIVSLGLILFVFLTFLLSLEEGREWAYISGISGLLLFLVHPYHFPTVFVVLGAYGAVLAVRLRAFPRIFFQSFLLFTILALPAVLYYVFLFRFDWVMTMRLNQGEALSTVWWSTLFSFGFLLPTALGGIYVLTRRKLWNDRTLFLFTWALVGGILIHTYVLVHPRRLTEGLMIPIAFFSFFGLVTIWSILMARSSKNVRTLFLSNTPLLFFLFLGFFGFTSFFHVVRDLSYFGSQLSVLYWPQEKMNATAWLNKKTAEEAVILASLDNGNIIPGFSGRTVYLGHGAETAFAQAKARDVLWFFGSGASDEARQRWLSREGITHLFISDDERALGDFRPEHVSYLREVFRSGTVSIYAVQREE